MGEKSEQGGTGSVVFPLREETEIEPDATRFEAMIESTGWTRPTEPVALSGYFLAQGIYPRLSEICARFQVVPVQETQVFRIHRTRPDGAITVTADYECTRRERLRVNVRLSGVEGVAWMEGTLSFLLVRQTPEDQS